MIKYNQIMIQKITIENIKGISNKTFELNITPNKPSILVAPNGFGKSSFAIAFNSLQSNKIKLTEENFYKNLSSLIPKLKIEYKDSSGQVLDLEATSTTNSISSKIDVFVINSQLKAKGIGSQFGTSRGEIIINDIILIDSIPPNTTFVYSYTNYKDRFGLNSKILPNLNYILSNKLLVEKLSNFYTALDRANGSTFQTQINACISAINEKDPTITSINLFNWIEQNLIENLRQVNHLKDIAFFINSYDLDLNDYSEVKSYLIAIQLIWLFNDDKDKFKKSCTYSNYLLDKQNFDNILSNINCTWKGIRTSQSGNKLMVKFPKAIDISNGQRDILTFISMLFRAQRKLKKASNVLIIDEVFDYLDDANLIAAQYYVTKFIQEFKDSGKRLYAIILTHLNPIYFKNYVFGNQKVYFLNKTSVEPNQGIIKLLRKRGDESIKEDVSKFLLHYHPNFINKRNEFQTLGIPTSWGENNNFQTFLDDEKDKYLSNENYCPLAVCGAIRNRIEKIAHDKLIDQSFKDEFYGTWKTREKLDFLKRKGINSPETHYLLGIIYNEGMHWKDNIDNITPIVNKLENLTIKNMIKEVFKD